MEVGRAKNEGAGDEPLTHDFVKDLEEPRDVRDLAGSEADALIKDNLRTKEMRWVVVVVVVVGHGQQLGAEGGGALFEAAQEDKNAAARNGAGCGRCGGGATTPRRQQRHCLLFVTRPRTSLC